MDTTNDEEESLTGKGKKVFADKLTQIALKQLAVSNSFKKEWLSKKSEYLDLLAGKVKKKLRIQFNVALPVFSGMLDTLAASFDEPVELEFKKKHPSDYFRAQKIQAAWNIEKNSMDKDAMWDYKARIDKKTNLIYGRSFLKEFAESDPKYKNYLEFCHPEYMHTQPEGGGILENHLFCGQEAILRTDYSISKGVESGFYDDEQYKDLKSKATSTEYLAQVTEQHKEKMAKYKSLGLDAENNNYVGEATYNLCEWVLTYKGKRYYLLFDPWTSTWLRCELLKDIRKSDLYPWTSWASHEDDKVFWSRSYADDIYPIADSVVTLFNQELTNREKRNMGARAYDKDMFPDVAKLDAAQYRADALVPVNTQGGSRKIEDGIYQFTTPELQGTITLIDWINSSAQKDIGVSDIAQGAAMQPTKKVNVAYMEQASMAKRIGYKSQSYTECWGQIGLRYYYGLVENMTEDMDIELLGDMGIEPDVLTKKEARAFKKTPEVVVISSTQRKQESQNKKAARVESLKLLMQSQNINSEWRDSAILRDIGGYEEAEIKLAMDTKNYASRESVAKAHIAIHELLDDEEPEFNFAADAVFLKVIFDYAMDHRNKLGKKKFKKFAMYLSRHAQAAMKNAQQKSKLKSAQLRQGQAVQQGQPQQGARNVATPAPAPEMVQQ